MKCEKCHHSYGHQADCVWEDAPVFLEYHPTKANHFGSLVDHFGKERHHCGGPGLSTITLYPATPTIPREFKVVPLNPLEVTLKAIAPSDPTEGKGSPKRRYDGFGDIKKSDTQSNQANKTSQPGGKSSQGGSGDPLPPIPFCDYCRATDCLELYSHSTPECLCCVSIPGEDSNKEESAAEEEKDTPASPVFTKKIPTPVFSASGNSLLTLAREAREANASSLQGMTNTLETMQQNLDRARQQTAVQSSEPGNQFILQQLEELQRNFLKVQEQIKAQNQAQKSEENKREVQRILDRMEVKAADRRAVVRENQFKREMEAGLKKPLLLNHLPSHPLMNGSSMNSSTSNKKWVN